MFVRRHFLRLFSVRKFTITKGIVLALFLTVGSLVCLAYYVSHFTTHSSTEQTPTEVSSRNESPGKFKQVPSIIPPFNVTHPVKLDSRALVMVETHYTQQSHEILIMLQHNRFRYKVELASKSLPNLTHREKGKYSLVVFERFESYLNMDKWNRELLDKYCHAYSVGIIAFTYPEQALFNAQARGFPLNVHTQLTLKDYEINAQSPVLRVTKPNEIYQEKIPGSDWTVFDYQHQTYSPIAWAKVDSTAQTLNNKTNPRFHTKTDLKYITAVLDNGLYDGIRRVIFGHHLRFWLHKLLLVDAISYLTHGKMSITMDRNVLIDIDDIFVGRTGVRMIRSDVQALVEGQAELAKKIPGFHFNLGYSGKFFHAGNEQENDGDDALIENRHHFWWFGHMWSHNQPHKLNLSEIKQELLHNKQFAKQYDIPVNQSYAVAPHHSGVFPVHEELYEAWKRIGGIKVTSTEEYPHLKPAQHRRGYIHRGIRVLPRQTCGLFTHTLLLKDYPEGGPDRLHRNIYGGELFVTFLTTPVMVFMTHLSNYGNDRLGLYTFQRVVDFVQKWTNLKLMTKPPVELAKTYFDMFPLERTPIWKNPCDDKRHLEIWSSKKNCGHLPHLLVIGPQKTGTTALYSFLNMHPAIVSNYNSPSTYEEVQFFGGKNYAKGLDWYLEFFPKVSANRTKPLLYEKSATYFDSDWTPVRAFSLLPKANIISILINPAERAYSWYQHQRAHENAVALSSSFYEVVTASEHSPSGLRDLRKRCLSPGLYAQHLEAWLEYYPSHQVLILDGEELKSNPVSVMDTVQSFLDVKPYMDYSLKLRYKSTKGFYCQIIDKEHTKCLGPGKGRTYSPMEERARQALRTYFKKPNIALSKLLGKISQDIPSWLQNELTEVK